MKRSIPIFYLGVNIACAALVLFVVHRISALMAAEERFADGVDSIEFLASSAPAILLALLTNIAWTGKAVVDVSRRRGYSAFAWLGTAAAIWIWALVVARLF